MSKFEKRGQKNIDTYKHPIGQKMDDAAKSTTKTQKKIETNLGKNALSQYFRARIYLKRSGMEFEQLRRDMINRYVAKSREYPMDINKINLQLEEYRLNITPKKKKQ